MLKSYLGLNRLTLSILILLSLTLSGCKKDIKEVFEKDNGACFSNTDPRVILHNEVNREYILYVPSSYDPDNAVPLLFNFHGFGGSASEHLSTADMRALSELHNFILVYPQGTCLDGASHWNACPLGGDNKSPSDDFGFVETLINQLLSEFNIDTNRVYAAGYSNGGMMAYGLANHKSELIAAVASVSGTMLDCIGSTSNPMPVIHLHGTADEVIPYDGNDFYPSAQTTLDHWIDFNNTNTTPSFTSDDSSGKTIEYNVYAEGDNSVSVEHYKYVGGGHVWFNDTFEGQNASELIWNFVSQYNRNGLR